MNHIVLLAICLILIFEAHGKQIAWEFYGFNWYILFSLVIFAIHDLLVLRLCTWILRFIWFQCTVLWFSVNLEFRIAKHTVAINCRQCFPNDLFPQESLVSYQCIEIILEKEKFRKSSKVWTSVYQYMTAWSDLEIFYFFYAITLCL